MLTNQLQSVNRVLLHDTVMKTPIGALVKNDGEDKDGLQIDGSGEPGSED